MPQTETTQCKQTNKQGTNKSVQTQDIMPPSQNDHCTGMTIPSMPDADSGTPTTNSPYIQPQLHQHAQQGL
jgi:hypothetical protein